MSQIDVKKVASLASLELTDAQVKAFSSQLEETLNYVEVLSELETNVEPTSQVTGLVTVTREDVIDSRYQFTQDTVISLTKGKHFQGYIVVDQVIDASD